MSTSSIVIAAVADVRAKFQSAADDIKTASDNYTYSLIPGKLPYWTLRLVSMETLDTGYPLVQFNITAEAVYHGWALTQGVNGEAEQDAQLHMILLPAELRARPLLQSTDYPSGSGYLASEGIRVTGARIAVSNNGSGDVMAVVTDFTIPLELQLEEGY